MFKLHHTLLRPLIAGALFFTAFFPGRIHAQVTLSFQGAEPGDTWGYTSTGADAVAMAQALMSPNIASGTASLVAGGNTAGGNCFDVGSGNGPSTARTFTFNPVDITSSNNYTRTLKFNWGNRYPVCSGTGWDSGENLVFTAYHDGVAQPSVTLATGYNNVPFSITTHQYTWSIPTCVNEFHFKVSVTTNRRDELLFIDDVKLTSPALNAPVLQPSVISGDTSVCPADHETYAVIQVAGIVYTWSGLPAGASFTSANGTSSAYNIGIDWGTATAGSYTLSVTPSDLCGSMSGPSRDIIINIETLPNAVISASGPSTFCPGDSVVFSAGGTGDIGWSTGDTSHSITAFSAGIYTLTLSNTCGASSISDTVFLHPPAMAGISTSGPVSICPGDTLVLSSSASTGNTWSTGDTSNSIQTGTGGLYILTVTGICGTAQDSVNITVNPVPFADITASGPLTFCTGDSVVLSSASLTGNTWSTGETGQFITATSAGNYILTVSGSCGTASDTQTVVVNTITEADITASGPTTFCEGGNIVLTSGESAGNTWSTGDTGAAITVNTGGIYVLTVTSLCGSSSDSVTIVVNPLPMATISSTGNEICPGDSLELTATGGSTFVWSNGKTGSSVFINTPGNYTVTATNGCGTSTSVPFSITALNLPIALISGNDTLCPGSPLTLTASGGTDYLWSTGENTGTINIFTGGTYTVDVSNVCGTNNATFTVVEDMVTADFSAAYEDDAMAPLEVFFTNLSTGADSFTWDFGNGETGNETSPGMTYNNGGTYEIILTAFSASGCSSTHSMIITVIENPSSINIPNIFTPNGDGINDFFKVNATAIKNFNAIVYNRWGSEVKQWSNVEEGWDGKDGSGMVTEGVYYYVIRAEGTDGKVYERSGSVTLNR